MWDRVDTLIAELAERQHGVVEHGQLIALGLSNSAIAWRVSVGRLHRLHVGVYAVGHRRLSAAGRRLAAVLACGRGALISHQTAADLWNIRPSASPRIHVTVPTTAGRERPGIVVHRTKTLRAEHAATVDGIPVTSVSRTLTDLARTLDPASLRKTVERADRLRILDVGEIEGSGRLGKAVREAHFGVLRSDLESDFLAACRAHGIRTPETNVVVAGHEVDFLWREERLIVETDGWAYDYTPDDLDRAPGEVAAALAQRKPRLRNQ